MTLSRILDFFAWLWRQLGMIWEGLKSLATWSFAKDLIPDWILKITVLAIPEALWGETPKKQIHGSIILIGWSIVTSLFTGWLTLGFVLFWSIFLFIGILRFSSAGAGVWDSVTSILGGGLPGRGSDGSYSRRKGGR